MGIILSGTNNDITTAGTVIPSYQFPASHTGATATLYAYNYCSIEQMHTIGSLTSFGGFA